MRLEMEERRLQNHTSSLLSKMYLLITFFSLKQSSEMRQLTSLGELTVDLQAKLSTKRLKLMKRAIEDIVQSSGRKRKRRTCLIVIHNFNYFALVNEISAIKCICVEF